jgi:hypothetical protein
VTNGRYDEWPFPASPDPASVFAGLFGAFVVAFTLGILIGVLIQ